MRPVTADEVLARSLADWSAYWDGWAHYMTAQVRWREAEREFRAERAAVGFLPDADNPHVAKFRSGEAERLVREGRRNMRRNQVKLARWKHEGYWFDSERRLQAPLKIHAPERRENVARPRERRARRVATSSRGSPDGSEPPLVAIPPAEFRRQLKQAGLA